MIKIDDDYRIKDELCGSCDCIIPDWSFVCPVCFCKETVND